MSIAMALHPKRGRSEILLPMQPVKRCVRSRFVISNSTSNSECVPCMLASMHSSSFLLLHSFWGSTCFGFTHLSLLSLLSFRNWTLEPINYVFHHRRCMAQLEG
ncbi:hypothetical protein BDN72DRAFT_376418 [Pluteus cervinus]|uniref:Uncharacterized protein n=1 Tax=Pluteus cervinus TaxID=181527 RepID=A0ACD3ABN9_9AGAR|nr:hypothetical protein BDN72DRAFT_376418 [Pluteus cervinus]